MSHKINLNNGGAQTLSGRPTGQTDLESFFKYVPTVSNVSKAGPPEPLKINLSSDGKPLDLMKLSTKYGIPLDELQAVSKGFLSGTGDLPTDPAFKQMAKDLAMVPANEALKKLEKLGKDKFNKLSNTEKAALLVVVTGGVAAFDEKLITGIISGAAKVELKKGGLGVKLNFKEIKVQFNSKNNTIAASGRVDTDNNKELIVSLPKLGLSANLNAHPDETKAWVALNLSNIK